MKNSKLFGFTTALILSLRQEHMCSHLRLMRGGEVPNIPTHPSINRWCCQRTACTKCCQRGIYIDNSVSETRTHVFTFTTNERGWGIKHPHSNERGWWGNSQTSPLIPRSIAGAVSERLVLSAVSEGLIATVLSLWQEHMCSHLRLMRGGWGIKRPHSSLDQALVLSANGL